MAQAGLQGGPCPETHLVVYLRSLGVQPAAEIPGISSFSKSIYKQIQVNNLVPYDISLPVWLGIVESSKSYR